MHAIARRVVDLREVQLAADAFAIPRDILFVFDGDRVLRLRGQEECLPRSAGYSPPPP